MLGRVIPMPKRAAGGEGETKFIMGGPQWSTMGGPRHAELLVRIMTRSPTGGWGVGAIITVLTLQKGKQSWGGIRTEKLREWEPS